LNISELLERLKSVGVDISERTLRQWAYDDLITRPDPPLPKEPKSRGRPSFKKQEKEREIGRGSGQGFKEWSEQSFEDAIAVWMIRHPSSGLENGETISNDSIKSIRHEAKDLHEMLINYVDDAHHYFFMHTETDKYAFDNDRLKDVDPSIVSWITVVEKLRHGILLDIPVRAVFEWITTPRLHKTVRIKYRQEGFQGVQLLPLERKDTLNEIELYECTSEGPEEEFNDYEPGYISITRVSEDGSIFYEVTKYFTDDYYNKQYLRAAEFQQFIESRISSKRRLFR